MRHVWEQEWQQTWQMGQMGPMEEGAEEDSGRKRSRKEVAAGGGAPFVWASRGKV